MISHCLQAERLRDSASGAEELWLSFSEVAHDIVGFDEEGDVGDVEGAAEEGEEGDEESFVEEGGGGDEAETEQDRA